MYIYIMIINIIYEKPPAQLAGAVECTDCFYVEE